MIKFGSYNVCILDLITDSKTGKLSAAKFWLHIANTIVSFIIYDIRPALINWEYVFLILVYLGVVGGSYIAIHLLKWKFRDAKSD